MINSWSAELCKTMTALKTCWVQEIPGKPPTTVESQSKVKINKGGSENNKRNNRKSAADEMDYLPPNPKHVPKSYWGPLLSSHLATFGSSIVVGNDIEAVNQVRF